MHTPPTLTSQPRLLSWHGEYVGVGVGPLLGVAVGSGVGLLVGDDVGDADGATLGALVGSGVHVVAPAEAY